jgi:hypothetical protein
MHHPWGWGWKYVLLPSLVLNPAMRKKEATMVAGLAMTTLGSGNATTHHRCRPLMMEMIVLVIAAAIVTMRNIHVMALNTTRIIGGRGQDNAMLHLLHATCNLCNVAVVAEITCDKCNIAAILQRLQQYHRDCSNVAFVACDCSNVAFVACNKCNIAEIANLKVYDCLSSWKYTGNKKRDWTFAKSVSSWHLNRFFLLLFLPFSKKK